ncbi:MAG: hypothetical protein CM15mP83_3900 [Flavobacteriaceae bacterium]|nr:MAG: hypothetical protein CM15mP83_3900 [Flavobacteriaceae bacterium]
MASVIDAFPNHRFVIAGTSNIDKSLYQRFAPNVDVVMDRTYDVLRIAQAASLPAEQLLWKQHCSKSLKSFVINESFEFAIAKRIVKLPLFHLSISLQVACLCKS